MGHGRGRVRISALQWCVSLALLSGACGDGRGSAVGNVGGSAGGAGGGAGAPGGAAGSGGGAAGEGAGTAGSGAPGGGGGPGVAGSGTGGPSAGAGGGAEAGGGAAPVKSGLNFRDGARLVARTFSFPGTPDLVVGIYDRQERVECAFDRATDNKLRCFPVDPTATREPMSRWQEGAGVLSPVTNGRVGLSEVHSADGGVFPNWLTSSLYETGSGQTCSAVVAVAEPLLGGSGLCLPPYASREGIGFADKDCTQPLASMSGTETPQLVRVSFSDLHAVGEMFTGTFFRNPYGARCMQGSTVEALGIRLYTIGAPLPPDTYPPVEVVPRGSGRLALQMVESETRTLAPDGYRDTNRLPGLERPYFDREKNRPCRPVWTASGGVRCFTNDITFTTVSRFGDPACTKPLVNIGTTVALMRWDAALGRQVVAEIRSVVRYPSDTAYVLDGGVCTSVFQHGAINVVDEILPLDPFARLDVRTGAE